MLQNKIENNGKVELEINEVEDMFLDIEKTFSTSQNESVDETENIERNLVIETIRNFKNVLSESTDVKREYLG